MLALLVVFLLLMFLLACMAFAVILVSYIFAPFHRLAQRVCSNANVKQDVKSALFQYDNELGRLKRR